MLANERFADVGVQRTSDNTKQSYAEFMRHWRFDPKLGREREFSDAELAALARQPVNTEPLRAPTEFEEFNARRKQERQDRPIKEERARQEQLAADVKRTQAAALLKLHQDEFALDSFYSTQGATQEEQQRVNTKMVLEGTYGNVAAHWHALAELRSR